MEIMEGDKLKGKKGEMTKSEEEIEKEKIEEMVDEKCYNHREGKLDLTKKRCT